MSPTSPSEQGTTLQQNAQPQVLKGPRNKPRARLVCTVCRQRKIKCDAEKIALGAKCTPCRTANCPCTIDRNGDRRRHGASQHKKLAEMQERIRSLEGMIQKASTEGPFLSAMHTPMAVDKAIEELQPPIMQNSSPDQHMSLPPDDMIVVERGQGLDERQDSNNRLEWQTHRPGEATDVEIGHNGREPEMQYAVPDLPPEPPTARASPLPTDFPTLTPNAASINDISMSSLDNGPPRVLRDKDTNEIAFYGTTTQLSVHSPDARTVKGRPDTDFQNGTTMNIDSSQLQKALLRIFFSIQPTSQIIVSESLFMRDRVKGGRQRYCSPFLRDSMLATATRHSTSSAVRRLGKKYAERAKLQIPSELEQPNIASLQGFLLLSDFEATRGRARLGWTYSILAIGLLVDLAFHVESPKSVQKDSANHIEAEFRDTLLLGTFVYATLWSFYLGRPNSIPSPVIAAVRRVVGDGSCASTLHMWVALCMQMQDIIEILHSPMTLGNDQRNASFRLCSHEINLRSVFDGVGGELAFDDERIDELDAEAYGPHIQYFGLQVTIHRAMMKAGQSGPLRRHEVLPKSLDHLYAVVHDNAVRIAKLVLSYRRIFGLENIITVMLDNVYVAAIALASHIVRMQQISQPFEDELRWLRSLYEVLEAVEKHYPVTVMMKSSLIHFIRQTPLVNIFPEKVPATSPSSVPESTVSHTTVPPPSTFYSLPGQAAINPPVPADSTDFHNLGFTLTTEDDWWLHDSAWNMTVLPFDM